MRFPSLDIFRGLAALSVFLFHYWTFYQTNLPSYFDALSIGHIGVDLFFVLSGFLVTLSLWRSDNFESYFQKRFWRIAPLAIGSICIFWLIKTDFSPQSFLDLFTHVTFINGFIPEFYHSINPVTWSISIEFAFYLLLPFLWLVCAKKNIKFFLSLCALLCILSFAYRAGLYFIFDDWDTMKRIIFSEQLWGRFDQFFLGILLAFLARHSERDSESMFSKYSHLNFLLGLIFIAISTTLFYIYQSAFREILFLQVFLHFIAGLGFFFLILSSLHIKPVENKNSNLHIFTSKSFSFLGTISYGIYIFHFPILSQVSKLIANPYMGFLLSFIVTIIISWISWEWFEKRFLKQK